MKTRRSAPSSLLFGTPRWEDPPHAARLVFERTTRGSERRQQVEDQEQKVERLDDRVDKVDRLDEPDVEAHKLDKMDRHDIGETEEPDVEAHRLDKFEGRVDKLD
jgi:hypothetical protein